MQTYGLPVCLQQAGISMKVIIKEYLFSYVSSLLAKFLLSFLSIFFFPLLRLYYKVKVFRFCVIFFWGLWLVFENSLASWILHSIFFFFFWGLYATVLYFYPVVS